MDFAGIVIPHPTIALTIPCDGGFFVWKVREPTCGEAECLREGRPTVPMLYGRHGAVLAVVEAPADASEILAHVRKTDPRMFAAFHASIDTAHAQLTSWVADLPLRPE